MKNIIPKTHWTIVAIIFVLFTIVLILSAVLIIKFNPQFNNRIIDIFWGVAIGLSTYIVTFIITNKFLYTPNDNLLAKVESLQDDFVPHDHVTKTILNIVQDKYMTLINYDRQKLLGIGFYANIFDNSREIKISGITLKHLLKSLLDDDNIIIKQLREKNNVRVNILLMHPSSQVVKMLDKQERTNNNPNPVSAKIKESLSILEMFSNKDTNIKLSADSRLEVRLTEENLNLTITYAGNRDSNLRDVLLMGLLFGHKKGGPLYQIPKEPSIGLYNDCLKYFDELFNEASGNSIFLWDDISNKRFTPL